MKLKSLKNKKILIVGFAREGRESFIFLKKISEKIPLEFAVADTQKYAQLDPQSQELVDQNRKTNFYFGEEYLRDAHLYEIIIRSPGIKADFIRPYLKPKAIITSQTEIFFDNFPGTIVAITGTKGKSTTAALIQSILAAANMKSWLIGNIGTPAFSVFFQADKDSVAVYEISSLQLSELKKSPHIAILLNISPEHLDFHKNFEEYVSSKANIALWQSANDYLVYNSKDATVANIAKGAKSRIIDFAKIKYGKIIDIKDIPLKADFYSDNIKAAIAVAQIFQIPDSYIAKGIKNFKPLPHRLEYLGAKHGILFYNDSLSTTPFSTNAAIKALHDNLHTIILGGYDRGLDFRSLAETISHSNIKSIIFFRPTGEKILEALRQYAPNFHFEHHFATNMKEAVDHCFHLTPQGKICLLSCASASFGMFRDYSDRGDQFRKYINEKK